MASPFLSEIKMFAGNFSPRGYAFCSGQILPIAQNTALFSLLGTTYGGNGQTTFALPDLRGRGPMYYGNGPGLTPRVEGEQSGSENVTLLSSQMPTHSHTASGLAATGNSASPVGGTWANSGGGRTPPPLYAGSANTTMSPIALGPAGGSQPHTNMQPYLVINFIIATEGIFPSRN